MCGRARRGQRDYFAYLIKDGKERRRASGKPGRNVVSR